MGNTAYSHKAELCFFMFLLISCANATEYMASKCGGTIYAYDSGDTLDSQVGANYDDNLDCMVTIRADVGRKILLTFERMSIEGNGYNCRNADYLQVFDGSTIYDWQLGDDMCGYTTPDDIVSNFNAITLRFQTDSLIEYTGFSLAYTSFSDGVCDYYEFECGNGRCIDSSLQYDGHDNCGDDSDEYDTNIDTYFQLSVGIIIAIVVGSILAFALITLGIGCVCYHAVCKSRPPSQSTVVVAQTPQQPAFNLQQPPMAMQQSGQPQTYGQQAPYGQPAYGQPASYEPPPSSYGHLSADGQPTSMGEVKY